jgi:hypothetical protein
VLIGLILQPVEPQACLKVSEGGRSAWGPGAYLDGELDPTAAAWTWLTCSTELCTSG